MTFIVLEKTSAANGKIRYIQFGEAHETVKEARKAAQFPGLRDPLIIDLSRGEKVENQSSLRLRDAEGHSRVRPQGSRGRAR